MTGTVVDLTFGTSPALTVESTTSSAGLQSIANVVSSNTVSVPPAEVIVDLPQGSTVSTPTPGASIGAAILTSGSIESNFSGSIVLAIADVVADNPANYAADPLAQACAPGGFTAVWRMSTTVLGLELDLPIFVAHPAGNPQATELRFCPRPLVGSDGKPVAGSPVPLGAASFILSAITVPTAPGSYTSSAIVTQQSSSGAPDPSTAVEARFLDPIPHVLSVSGRYDGKTHDAVLTGRVAEEGKPQAGAVVEYTNLINGVLPKHVRTTAKGTFTLHIRIAATTTFELDVADAKTACPGPSTAPKGCASLTVAGTNDRLVRVAVPRH
ncbi:MAG TPA: hypothetical protein VLJ76_03290 [Gaiellaceae bacterium]|nr:hypothetical protein [Gaiellaceae bacterium]